MKVLSGVPSGISTSPLLCTLPTREKTLVPELLALPVSVNHAGPLVTMGAMLYQVSTLLMLLGLPHRPFCAGKGGRGRGRPASPSSDAISAVSSPQTKAPAPSTSSISNLKPRPRMLLAQQTVLAGLFDGTIQAMYRQRILGAHIDDALGRAHHVAADDHAFQQGMRIALDLVAVHVGAGIAFVGIADDVLLVGNRLAQELPLVAGEEAGAAAPAQLGSLDLLDDALRLVVDQRLVQRLVAADRDVFLDVVGIDQAAVAQHDLLLALEEGHLVPRGHSGIAVPVADGAGDVVPLFDLAVDQVGIDIAGSRCRAGCVRHRWPARDAGSAADCRERER